MVKIWQGNEELKLQTPFVDGSSPTQMYISIQIGKLGRCLCSLIDLIIITSSSRSLCFEVLLVYASA